MHRRARGLGAVAAVFVALVACGARATAALPTRVNVHVTDLRLAHAGELRVELRSADGRAHRAELRASAAAGSLRVLPAAIDVPAAGVTRVALRVFRGDATWDSRHEIDVVALAADDGTPLGLGSAVVDVASDPALVPRLRPWLTAAGLLLLLAAVVQEWRREARA